MNAFLRSVEARLLREREQRLLSNRGDELPNYCGPCDEPVGPTIFAEQLAERRKVVAKLRAEGRSQPQIAGILGLSVRQVRHAQAPR